MNNNQNQAVVIGNLTTVYGALNDLVNNWDSDTQELFERFSGWDLPSLDDAMSQVSSFREFLISHSK
jgi:hypothetical protein